MLASRSCSVEQLAFDWRRKDNACYAHPAEISLSRMTSLDQWTSHSLLSSIRLFVSQCAKCHQTFSKNDLFLRTTSYRRFHLDCFRCDHCDRLLSSGDEYYIHRQHEIYCRQHFPHLSFSETSSMESKSSCSDSIGISSAGKTNLCRAMGKHTSIRRRMWLGREGRNRWHAAFYRTRKSDQSGVHSVRTHRNP